MQERTAAVTDLIERSPPDWRTRIVRNSSRRGLRFAVYSENPLAGQEPTQGMVYLRLDALPRNFLESLQRRSSTKGRSLKADRLVAATSQALADGNWLLAVKVLPDPPRSGLNALLISLLFAVLLALLVVWITSRWITRPLARLARAAEHLGRGEKTPALDETGPQDIRQTTHAFNQMRERLERFVADRTRMLAAISHDMRTPLTALRLRAEFIDDAENREKILAALDDMQAMTEATLAFAKNEHNNENTTAVDLSALIDALCEDYRALGKHLVNSNTPRCVTRCRQLALRRALRNLIDNALVYGDEATLELQASDKIIVITITDNGPGIADQDLARVFEPFVRLEESRNRDTGGVGLGLSIARTIIHAHGGELWLANRAQGGLQASIQLPRTASI